MSVDVGQLLEKFDIRQRRERADAIIQYIKRTSDFIRTFRGDDSEAVFAEALLTSAIGTVFEHRYKEEIWGPDGGILSFDTSANPAAMAIAWREVDRSGEAELISDDGHDAPAADAQGKINIEKPGTVATRISWTYKEALQSGMDSAINLGKQRGIAAKEAWNRGIARYVRQGLPGMNWAGVYNLPNSVNATAITGAWASAATTSQQVIDDFHVAHQAIYDNTDGVESKPNTAIIAGSAWGRLYTKYLGDNADRDTFEALSKAYPHIDKWVDDTDLNFADDAGTGPAMVLFNRNQDKLRGLLPQTFTPRPVQITDLESTTLFISQYAGLAVPSPLSFAKLNGI